MSPKPNWLCIIAHVLVLPCLVGCGTLAETIVTAGTLGLIEPDLDGYDNNISPWALNHSGPSETGAVSAPITGQDTFQDAAQTLPSLAVANPAPQETPMPLQQPPSQTERSPAPAPVVQTETDNYDIYGVWRSSEGIYRLDRDGTGTLTMESINGNPGTLTTYFDWSHDPSTGNFTYTINRMTLTDSVADYDRQMDRTYTVPYELTEKSLLISSQQFYR